MVIYSDDSSDLSCGLYFVTWDKKYGPWEMYFNWKKAFHSNREYITVFNNEGSHIKTVKRINGYTDDY